MGGQFGTLLFGMSPTSRLCSSSNKCLTNRILLEREMNKPPSDSRLSGNDKVIITEIWSTKRDIPNVFDELISLCSDARVHKNSVHNLSIDKSIKLKMSIVLFGISQNLIPTTEQTAVSLTARRDSRSSSLSLFRIHLFSRLLQSFQSRKIWSHKIRGYSLPTASCGHGDQTAPAVCHGSFSSITLAALEFSAENEF